MSVITGQAIFNFMESGKTGDVLLNPIAPYSMTSTATHLPQSNELVKVDSTMELDTVSNKSVMEVQGTQTSNNATGPANQHMLVFRALGTDAVDGAKALIAADSRVDGRGVGDFYTAQTVDAKYQGAAFPSKELHGLNFTAGSLTTDGVTPLGEGTNYHIKMLKLVGGNFQYALYCHDPVTVKDSVVNAVGSSFYAFNTDGDEDMNTDCIRVRQNGDQSQIDAYHPTIENDPGTLVLNAANVLPESDGSGVLGSGTQRWNAQVKSLNVEPEASPPATATDPGTEGDVRVTQNYIYYCYADNNWTRAALSTW